MCVCVFSFLEFDLLIFWASALLFCFEKLTHPDRTTRVQTQSLTRSSTAACRRSAAVEVPSSIAASTLGRKSSLGRTLHWQARPEGKKALEAEDAAERGTRAILHLTSYI